MTGLNIHPRKSLLTVYCLTIVLFGQPISTLASSSSSSTQLEKDGSSSENRLAFLDVILDGYDKRACPTYGEGKPTDVKINMYVNSLGSISAASMEYIVDIYLRQSWLDPRLDIRPLGLNSTVTLNGEDIITRIWKPDLFFRNVKEANFHMVTVPNFLIKLSPDGHILYSMRLTLRLSCHMSFRHYPLDTQRCHVIFGSYSQSVESMTISWMDNAVLLDPNLEISEFEVESVDPKGPVFENYNDVGLFSYLNVTFVLKRQNGYHMVQTYLPTFLIVTISWVSFWLNVDAVPARVTLGVTTLLTLTTVASGVRTQLPPVSYVKAIDVWIGACSVMVFGALLEFTLVNYLSRSRMKSEHLKSFRFFCRNKQVINKEEEEKEDGEGTNKKRISSAMLKNLQHAKMVDKVCRISFPLSFFVFNLVYWISYVHILED
ncbi:glycine receptor subunit alpha-4-like [Limulus polyphemus]|uniref:Glycine receptor subunit alpha-4-like n=1 Tax=Limulus polyphemus TaxID=6850 RepID=A0ABM1SBW9_LIMPO|nr:glycine receptor subunit alpha-4-like [Limulus polyphemus]